MPRLGAVDVGPAACMTTGCSLGWRRVGSCSKAAREGVAMLQPGPLAEHCVQGATSERTDVLLYPLPTCWSVVLPRRMPERHQGPIPVFSF